MVECEEAAAKWETLGSSRGHFVQFSKFILQFVPYTPHTKWIQVNFHPWTSYPCLYLHIENPDGNFQFSVVLGEIYESPENNAHKGIPCGESIFCSKDFQKEHKCWKIHMELDEWSPKAQCESCGGFSQRAAKIKLTLGGEDSKKPLYGIYPQCFSSELHLISSRAEFIRKHPS